MKRLLLTLIVTLTLCGSIFAQTESHWPPFVNYWEDQSGITAAIAIDGYVYTVEDEGWNNLEVAFFVFNAETSEWECRGTENYLDRNNVDLFGEPYPILPGSAIRYTNTGELVYFRMFDHNTGIEYDLCDVTYQGEPMTILTGIDHFEAWSVEPYDPIILNFTAITKEITGYDNGGGWYLISSPVGEVSVDDVENLTINEFNLYYFDQQGDEYGKEWMNYEMGEGNDPGFTTLECGKGYLYANESDVTLIFPGIAYEAETVEVPVYYYESNADQNMWGWNLVGNPFNAQATIGDEPFYRMSNGTLLPDACTGAIEPMEGVFVLATADGDVTFAQYQGSKSSSLALNLTEGEKVIDRAIVGFGEGKTLPRLQFNNSSKVYFPMEGKEYAIVRSEGMGEVPVSFKAESNGTYNLSLSSENVEFSYLHLIDNLTGADQDLLANPSYSFSANTTDYASRFRLVFATGNNEDNFAFFSNGSLFVNNEGNPTLQVVDVTGRIIMSENINGSANVNIDAAPGVYMVRLVNGDNMKVQKVVK